MRCLEKKGSKTVKHGGEKVKELTTASPYGDSSSHFVEENMAGLETKKII